MKRMIGLLLGTCLIAGCAVVAAQEHSEGTMPPKILSVTREWTEARQERPITRENGERLCPGTDPRQVAHPLPGGGIVVWETPRSLLYRLRLL